MTDGASRAPVRVSLLGAPRMRPARLLAALAIAACVLAPAAPSPATASALARTRAPWAPAVPPPASALAAAAGGVARPDAIEARPAAADGLDVATSARYAVDPATQRVAVGVDVTAVNRLPVTPGARYYYTDVNLALQPEATQIWADAAGAPLPLTMQARDGYRLLSIGLTSRLYSGQTARLHVAYVLPGGAPRSSSGVRVGAAHAALVVWSFGDRGTVEVDVPAGFSVEVRGGPMASATGADGATVLTADTTDAGAWYAWLDARNDGALTSQPLKLPGGEQVVVRAWPDDPAWQRGVSGTLTDAIPELQALIGLPWPVTGQLSVLEVSGSQLEGYAGFYAPGTRQITISEDLDPLTIVHEASHAWFNATLFSGRWLTEGLANEYASRVLVRLGGRAADPRPVRTSDAVAFALDTWGPPAPIRSARQDAREQWAYDASWTALRAVVTEVGQAGMARVLTAARAGTTAYVGAGPPEPTALPSDWRRFVDLAEEVGGGAGVPEIVAPWALTATERSRLAPRRAARQAYHALLAAAGDWAAPSVVRADLDRWDFEAASDAIATAQAAVATRDAIRERAGPAGLAVPAGLRAGFEGAATAGALAQAAADETALLGALGSVAAAEGAAAAPRDWLVLLGLAGQDPATGLASVRSAWEAGDAAGATAASSAVRDQLATAADAGRLRVAAITLGAVAFVLLLAILRAALRRRRGRDARVPPDGPEPPSGAPGTSRPYPILPASATAGEPPEPTAGVADGGAE